MKQIPLAIAGAADRTFDDYLAGPNAAAVAHLRTLPADAPAVYLWGPSGTGKTHLLHAAATSARRDGRSVAGFDAGSPAPWTLEENRTLAVIDDCDALDAAQQQAAFALFVEATTRSVPIVAAGRLPPTDLPLREDLRTRLGWGYVYALQPLGEAEVRAALRREADRRGTFLSDDVMDYLLRRFFTSFMPP